VKQETAQNFCNYISSKLNIRRMLSFLCRIPFPRDRQPFQRKENKTVSCVIGNVSQMNQNTLITSYNYFGIYFTRNGFSYIAKHHIDGKGSHCWRQINHTRWIHISLPVVTKVQY